MRYAGFAAMLVAGALTWGCGGSSAASPAPTSTSTATAEPTLAPTATPTPTPTPPRPGAIVFLAQAPAGLVAEVVDWEGRSLAGTAFSRGFPYSSNAAISPDATRVAYLSPDLGGRDVFVAGIDGSGVTNLTRSPGDYGPPLWSPDGKRLAFTMDGAGGTVLRIVDADTGATLAAMGDLPGEHRGLSWLPGGDGFVFLATGEGDRLDVYTLSLEGTVDNVTRSEAAEVETAVSSERVVAVIRESEATAEPPPSGTFAEARDEATATPPVTGAEDDATTPAAASDPPVPGESRETWLLHPGGAEERLELPGLRGFSQLRWSPDGRHLSFLARRESGAEALYLLDVDSGAGPRVAFARSRVDEWTWSPDSSAIAIVANGGACGRTCPRGFLHVVDLGTGNVYALQEIRVVSAVVWPWE